MKPVLLGIIGLALTVAVAIGAIAQRGGARSAPTLAEGPYRGSEPPAGFELPAFALRDQEGTLIRSGGFRGKAVAVTFLDTQCEETCPIVAGLVADGIAALPVDEADKAVAIAISVDPDEDTPASVRTFLRRNRATEELHYLVAPRATLAPIWRRFQILSSYESGDDEVHSAPVRIYDPDGVWVSSLHAGADLTAANLAHDLRTALGRGREPK